MRRFPVGLAACMALAACGSGPPSDAENAADMAEAPVGSAAPAAGPLVFCDVIQQRVAASDCDDLRALKDDVRKGGAALNAPDPMMRGETVAVHLVIDRRPSQVIAELDAAANATANQPENASADVPSVNAAAPPEGDEGAAPGARDDLGGSAEPTPTQIVGDMPGTTQAFAPKVGRFMSASLSGQGFDIKRVAPETASQEIPEDGQATWSWEVTARQEGPHTLIAKTVVEGEINGTRYPLAGTQTAKVIRVKVSTLSRVREYLDALPGWMKSLTAALTALAALVAAWFGVRTAIRKGRAAT
jgi:hypothetical protein